MTRVSTVLAICLFACSAAPPPDSVTAKLSLDSPGDHFKIGEPIVLDLTFTASQPGYTLNTTTTSPASPIDTLVVAPMTGVFPWLDDQARSHRYSPDYGVSTDLAVGKPVTVKLPLNAVYRFDRPGHYAVHVVTDRVYHDAMLSGGAVAMATGDVAFDVEPMAAAEELQRAEFLVRSIQDSSNLRAAQPIAEDLDWLTGEPSTRAKLALFLHPKRFYPFAVDVTRGLWVARDRALVVRELERALDDPSQLVSSLLRLAVELEARLDVPFDPAAPAVPLPVQRVKAEYLQRLAASLSKRTGEPLIDAARTLFVEFAGLSRTGTPEFAAAREVIITHFGEVNEYNVDTLLNRYGVYLLDPRIVPALKRILEEQSNPILNGERTAVLQHLTKLAPDEARPMLVHDICAFNTALLQIAGEFPFVSLPETDACLRREVLSAASGSSRQQRLDWAMEFAAHFASPAIYDDLLNVYQNSNGNLSQQARGYLLAYLVRWDAQRGLPLLESAVPADSQDPDVNLTFALSRAYSPPQRAFLVRRLEIAPPVLASYAAWQMSNHAPAEDRALLTARLQRWRQEWTGREVPRAQANLEAELTQAAIHGKNWQASETDAESLRAGCVSAECKARVAVHP